MNQSKAKAITPHDDLNAILTMLSDGLRELLDSQLVGLYLTGSLTYGDFDRGSSDIDVWVVLDTPLSPAQLLQAQQLHDSIGQRYPEWAKRIESSYITNAMLERLEVPKEPRLYVNNGGHLKEETPDNSWIIDLYDLRESGIALVGAAPQDVFPRVPIERVRQASRAELHSYWIPQLTSETPFDEPGHDTEHIQAFAVLTMCRILHRAKNNEVASKRAASNWTKQTYPEWKSLIEKAENWQHGQQMDAAQDTLDFIRFTLDQVG